MSAQITTMPNGLRVVSKTVKSVETVSLGVWVHVGARQEPAAWNGISHLLEHMAFKGTISRSAQQIAEQIEAVGGYMNAYTSREATAYYVRVLRQDIRLGADVIADILRNSIFDGEELAKEKTVVLQEIGQSYDTPDDIIFDHFQATAFPHQPLGRAILGTSEIVTSITPDDLKAYMGKEYHPSRMVLAAAGNIEHEELVALAQEFLNNEWQIGGHTFAPTDIAPATYQGGCYLEDKSLEQVHVVLGFAGVPITDKRFHQMMVASTILGGGMSSRLFQEIREKRGLVYSIYSHASSYRDTGLLSIYAGTSPNDVIELIPVIFDELHKLAKNVTITEVNRAKAQLKASLMMGLESMPSQCEQLANHTLNFGAPIPAPEILARIDAVTPEMVTNIVETTLRSKPTAAILGSLQKLHGSRESLRLIGA
jgi:predicted Zn-dependent peptidase